MPFAYSRVEVPDGVAGTLATVEHIIRLVRAGTQNARVRRLAVQVVRGAAWKNKRDEASRVFAWLRANIEFRYDPEGAELLQEPGVILDNRAADCDDFVILGASLLRSIGIPVRIVIIGADPAHPQAFSHIYLHAYMGDAWVGFDPSVTDATFGWEAPRYTVKKIIPVED